MILSRRCCNLILWRLAPRRFPAAAALPRAAIDIMLMLFSMKERMIATPRRYFTRYAAYFKAVSRKIGWGVLRPATSIGNEMMLIVSATALILFWWWLSWRAEDIWRQVCCRESISSELLFKVSNSRLYAEFERELPFRHFPSPRYRSSIKPTSSMPIQFPPLPWLTTKNYWYWLAAFSYIL